MGEFFNNYVQIIVFLHVLGAIIWVGGMIAIRVAVHPILQTIEDTKLRLEKSLAIMGRLFYLVAPFILIIMATGLIMALGMNGHHTSMKKLFIAKEAIWTIMALNYSFMLFKLFRAKKLFNSGDLDSAKSCIKNIPTILLPINIFLGLVALYFGINIRGF